MLSETFKAHQMECWFNLDARLEVANNVKPEFPISFASPVPSRSMPCHAMPSLLHCALRSAKIFLHKFLCAFAMYYTHFSWAIDSVIF